jgi:hypothetical protein
MPRLGVSGEEIALRHEITLGMSRLHSQRFQEWLNPVAERAAITVSRKRPAKTNLTADWCCRVCRAPWR